MEKVISKKFKVNGKPVKGSVNKAKALKALGIVPAEPKKAKKYAINKDGVPYNVLTGELLIKVEKK